jgi:hypothetical protein
MSFKDHLRFMNNEWKSWGSSGAPFGQIRRLQDHPEDRHFQQPLVIPGLAAGPNGFDTLTWDSTPTNCASNMMPWRIPDSTIMDDPYAVTPVNTARTNKEPYQPWTYSLGGWP